MKAHLSMVLLLDSDEKLKAVEIIILDNFGMENIMARELIMIKMETLFNVDISIEYD